MPLILDDDQTMLRDTAHEFMMGEGSIAKQLRHWRDNECKDGFGHDLWRQFGEMGFAGMLASEADGGLGMGAVEAGVVMEEIGRNLTPSPFLSTAIVGVTALAAADDDLRARWLPGIVAGETVLGIAIDEGAKHDPANIAMTAEKSGNGFRLDGRKRAVLQGGSADALIVVARTSGSAGETQGLTVFAVPTEAAGLTRDAVRLVDSAMAAHCDFSGVEVDGGSVIGDVDNGWEVVSKMLAAGRAGAAAEAVGVGGGAMDITFEYLKGRKQFGRHIGSFQALQHRAAHLYSEIEIARAAVLKACQLIDENADNAELMVSVAKAKAGDAANLAVREGVQMHGGVGMTDEYDIGLYMKRDRALAEYFGDTRYHANRVAELLGY